MYEKIITHSGQAHRDDFLACCLLLAAAGAPIIERRNEVSETELSDPKVAVVDIGGQFNSKLNNFDHHHDSSLPCSLHLVASAIFGRSDFFDVFPWWNNLNIQDTQGFPKLARNYGLEPRQLQELGDPIGGIILQEFSKIKEITWPLSGHEVTRPESPLYSIMRSIGEHIIDSIHKFEDHLSEMQVDEYDGIQVAITRKKANIARFAFARQHGLNIVIAPNERGPGFTLTRVDNAPDADIDFRRCEGMEGVTFIHHTGFMCVVENDNWNWRPYVKKAFS